MTGAHLAFEAVHQPDGWLTPGYLRLAPDGTIAEVSPVRPSDFPAGATPQPGIAIPGMPNLHSHGFQRAMAGFAEVKGPATDSFWTWREAMYRCAQSLTPEALEDVAAMAFLEMLRAGYTSVAEFHYLHHTADGTPYADRAELSWRVLSAAARVGLGMTFLPVLYQHGGFGKPLQPRQLRFAHRDVDEFLGLCRRVHGALGKNHHRRLGVAPHSLRAVDERSLHTLLSGLDSIDASAPVHIHVAEQRREVEECVAALDARPVAFLLSRFALGPRWCLVHATHIDDGETLALAHSEAVAGICPSTEGNLGDGFFNADSYLAARGQLGVGSDSQIECDPCGELRLLEYSLRLRREQRNVLAGSSRPRQHVGRHLWDTACAGGARALGQKVGSLTPGQRTDLVVLDPEHPRLIGHGTDTVLDAFVFSAGPAAVRDVYVGGKLLIEHGHHRSEDEIRSAFARTMRKLWSQQ